jgi:hypothetical protein
MFSEQDCDMGREVLVLVWVLRVQSCDIWQISINILVGPAAFTGLWLMHSPSPFFPFPLLYTSFLNCIASFLKMVAAGFC